MKPRTFISFSGGRTSGYMTKRLVDERRSTHDLRILFANTGQENEQTLEFVDRCDREWNLGVVWIEALTDPRKGKGVRARVVDFASASRNGEPFEAMIAKHGIPNRNFPHCTRETKTRPMRAWLRENGWKSGTYTTAIGIRADEIDRIPEHAIRTKERLEYPLASAGIKERDVIQWWRGQGFDLILSKKNGNCKWCWKKSLSKLVSIAVENPEHFDFPIRMEEKYGHAGTGIGGPHTFFRERRSAKDILELASRWQPDAQGFLFEDNQPGGCGDSCEVYSDL